MPLSEDEQRILQGIERSFYETDPEFARTVGSTSLYRHAGRNCKLSALCFLAGLVVLVTSFSRIPLVGFGGFLIMVVSSFFFVRNLGRMGAAGLDDVRHSAKVRNLGESIEDVRSRLRDRFNHED